MSYKVKDKETNNYDFGEFATMEEAENYIKTELADDETTADYYEVIVDNNRVINDHGQWLDFDAATVLMDDGTRESVHADIAPCTNQVFFDAYCIKHRETYGAEFEPNKENSVW